jgi:HK97 family phage major capsid protein
MSNSLAHIKTLREARSKAHADAVSVLKDGITSENRAKYDRAMDAVEQLGREIQAAERGTYVPVTATEDREKRYALAIAFDRYLRGGVECLNQEQRSLLNERRDQTAGTQTISQTTGSAGGYLIPAGFADELESATKYYADLMNVCRTIKTESGSVLPFPTSNDTGNAGVLLAENGTVTEQDVTYGSVSFQSYKITSRLVKASAELLNDSAFDIYADLAQKFGERFGRAFESYFTTGSGSSQPTGLLTAIAASGASAITAAGSSANDGSANTGANSIGSQDLVNLEHSVDPSYRKNARYMFHDKTLGFLKGLLDKYGRPLWTPGVANGAPDTISGYPYVINQSMPQIGASNVTVIFGDFSKFIIRRVSTPSIKRLSELFALTDEIGFVGFSRVDSNLVDAGTHPLNVLQQHS